MRDCFRVLFHYSIQILSALSIIVLTACTKPIGDRLPEFFLFDSIFPPLYKVSGEVTGLMGQSLILSNADGNTVQLDCLSCPPAQNVPFQFPEGMRTDSRYYVKISSYPSNPTQICDVYQNAGLIDNSHIDNVVVQCEDGYRVSGAVSGLAGSGLVITLNGTQSMTLNAGATAFTFPIPEYVSVDPSYVRVTSQPTNPWQTCQFNIVDGGGNAVADYTSGDVDISGNPIECTTNVKNVSAQIVGLAYDGLQVTINGSPYTYNAGATTTALVPTASGQPYGIFVTASPSGQQCSVVYGGGNGTTTLVQNADIVARIECNTNTYSVAGAITGLTGSGLRIQMTGAYLDTTPYTKSVTPAAGATGYSFAGGLHYGDTISTLTITQQPSSPAQFCSFSSGGTSYSYTGGSVTGNVTLPSVVCSTNTLQGTVSGYSAPSTGLVVRYNDTTTATSQQIALEPGDAFTFPTVIGHSYTLSIVAQPYNPGYDCLFSDNTTTISGTISSSSVTQNISCNPTPPAAFPTISMAGVTNTITFAGPPGAKLCYRTDGGNPACALAAGGTAYSRGGECASGSTQYGGSFTISSTTTFRAVSCLTLSAFDQSAATLYTATVAGTAATPTFSPAGGVYSNDLSVSISSTTAGATIFYNKTGSALGCDGTNAESSFPSGGSISVGATGTTFYAIACKAGMNASSQSSSTYTLQVAAPTIEHDAYGKVTISGTTSGATYRYSTLGANPTCITGTSYTGAFVYPLTKESIRVIGCKASYMPSSVSTRVVRVKADIRVTGLYTGNLDWAEEQNGVTSAYSETGAGSNGALLTTSYPVAGYQYKVRIEQQVTAVPGPRCLIGNGSGDYYIMERVWVPTANFDVSIGCAVFAFKDTPNPFITKTFYVNRCPVGQEWDAIYGGCTGPPGGYKYCAFSDNKCNVGVSGGFYVTSDSPLHSACWGLSHGPYGGWRPFQSAAFLNTLLNLVLGSASARTQSLPGISEGTAYWSGQADGLDATRALYVIAGTPFAGGHIAIKTDLKPLFCQSEDP
ncbi:chitobiase/beta-hexosaminidase C-terminal domain-containing protein [Leptonema illini]|uniref:Lipoprotein n=1 Tax=Leptonema illini DSM 21528 TaxID=929563 RepID=H2CCD5_9LEPT|nr:chitobiase/beta-hexosaminidase C-terminal domain-containing protein [Leptonema illini]EHQ06392.1 hypothetical protein Lepil_1708 [Leptonema illini DSM 21528]